MVHRMPGNTSGIPAQTRCSGASGPRLPRAIRPPAKSSTERNLKVTKGSKQLEPWHGGCGNDGAVAYQPLSHSLTFSFHIHPSRRQGIHTRQAKPREATLLVPTPTAPTM